MGLTVQANFYCFMFFTTAIHTDLLLSIDAFYCFWSFCFLLCKILSISIDFFQFGIQQNLTWIFTLRFFLLLKQVCLFLVSSVYNNKLAR
jgi:hypothetical protein